MTGAYHLAPMVSVEYWRNSPAGIVKVRPGTGEAIVADFAILMAGKPVARGWDKITTRFELPAQAEQLAVVLAATNAAYALGHHDRINRMRAQFGFVGIDKLQTIAPIERGTDDRA